MSIMYGTLLRKYESVKDDYGLVNQRLTIITTIWLKARPNQRKKKEVSQVVNYLTIHNSTQI